MGEDSAPSGTEPKWPSQAAYEFLLAEYGHVSEAWLANEEWGERRLNLFMAVIAAATAALGLALERLGTDVHRLELVIASTALVLLLLGLATLRRLIERNLTADEYLEALRRMRQYIVDRDPAMLQVVAFAPSRRPRSPRTIRVWRLGKSGFLETNALINCLLTAIALSVGVAAAGASSPLWVATGAIAALAAWWLQRIWVIRVYALGIEERRNARAGALTEWETAGQ